MMTFKYDPWKLFRYGLLALVFVLGLAYLAGAAEVTITDPVNEPFVYPAKVTEMSDAEFFKWATKFNKRQEREIVRSPDPEWLHGYGVRTRVVYGVSGMEIVREGYPRRYKNPDYFPSSPLTVVNPYCKPKK